MTALRTPRWIYLLQVASVGLMWVFVIGIGVWIVHRLQDVPSATVAISIVAIPVFLTGAAVLTYVFVGLQRGAAEPDPGAGDSE